MKKELNQEKFEKIMERIIEDLDNGAIIIVEGKKDRISLEKLGLKNIIEINKGDNLVEFADNLTAKKIIILTDFDRRGALLKKRLKELLETTGRRVNTKYRKDLNKVTGVKYFEELYSIIIAKE
ncbi:MAG: toprim domain-containing protein [Candidatus Diapherotrites archaeon]|nr:toprim domain-containing protein [Candidatus Diapherotrites archaeon]